jgi:sugar lactone lactonase YvrE
VNRLPGAAFGVVVLSAFLALSPRSTAQSQLEVGYTRLEAAAGSTLAVGAALFSYTNAEGVLVSEAGVGAAEPVARGRLLVDESGPRSAVALVNPSTAAAAVTLALRDRTGALVDSVPVTIAAGGHLARFVGEIFAAAAAGFAGSLTFESSQPLGAIALRQSLNALAEPIYSTLPVVDLDGTRPANALAFPQVSAGGGYTTQILLMNTESRAARGRIVFTASDAGPLQVRLGGTTASAFDYAIEPHGVYYARFERTGTVAAGYAVAEPASGSAVPAGAAMIRFDRDGAVVTEAGVAPAPATASGRIFVESGAATTGLALANPSDASVAVRFTLRERDGTVRSSATRALGPRGHLAVFAHQLFPELPPDFTGLLDLDASLPIVPATLRQTENGRGEFVLTTLPVADLERPPRARSVIFPHIATGGGFATRLVLISPGAAASAGSVLFYRADGSPWSLPVGAAIAARIGYALPSGGGRRFLPGSTLPAASILIRDPASGQDASEIAVNEGRSVHLDVVVLDARGAVRDDLEPSFSVTGPDIASVDGSGNVRGLRAGFSTVTAGAGAVLKAATIAVVKVESGPNGWQITGVAQDLARRLYLANSADHTLMLLPSLAGVPSLYAGVAGTAGLRNASRLESLFQNPAQLAYHQREGSLYVCDTANHVIRRVPSITSGTVETVAGTGVAGSRDGPAREACFNQPRGIALDNAGNLWVADSGNHTIRRINLAAGRVETIAGASGSAGWVDDRGAAARFSSPAGIAIEPESRAQEIERERRGAAPPPVSILVADTGNGAIRRVRETGEAETLRAGSRSGALARGGLAAAAPLAFDAPAAVAVDPAGSVYVSEPSAGRVRTILQSGEVVASAQAGTFARPEALAILQGGRVLVTERGRAVRELAYGEPEILSVTPATLGSKGGERVTITGRSFAPDTIVVAAGVLIRALDRVDTESIAFVTPELPSGIATLTIQNRGGVAQRSLPVRAVPLASLPPGDITTVAGGSTFAGDGGTALQAGLALPRRMALDAAGNLYVSDSYNHRIRRLTASTGILTTVAGQGTYGFSGDGGPATAAELALPTGVAVDASGNIVIGDIDNFRVRRLEAATGSISTIAGTGAFGATGDSGPATDARLSNYKGVATDAAGNVFVADTENHRIRRIDAATGVITTVAGSGEGGYSGDGAAATAARLRGPHEVAIDAAGNLYIADTANYRVRKVTAATGVITTIAGIGEAGYSGDDGPAVRARLGLCAGISVNAAGEVFVADTENNRIRKISTDGTIRTLAGTGAAAYSGDGGPATAAALALPWTVLPDGAGNILVCDTFNHRIRRIDVRGTITTVAGTGEGRFGGDGGLASAAQLWNPSGIARDARGNTYVADTENNRIRRVDAVTEIITTIAGTGTGGYAGDGGPATAAQILNPYAVAIAPSGDIYLADTYNQRIRRIDASSGIITTVAGDGGYGYSGDGGPAVAARLAGPQSLAPGASGDLYIADTANHCVRLLSRDGTITTVAGTGESGYSGDGGPAARAALAFPAGIAVDAAGGLWIADTRNHRIRRVDAASRTIATVAGTGTGGYTGDGGAATAARLQSPAAVALDAAGNLYIMDRSNQRIRRVERASGVITTVAGDGRYAYAGDNHAAIAASFRNPLAILLDPEGNLFIADAWSHRVRAIRGPIP